MKCGGKVERLCLEIAMPFRWIAILTLWTILSGPVFAPVSGHSTRNREGNVRPPIQKPILLERR